MKSNQLSALMLSVSVVSISSAWAQSESDGQTDEVIVYGQKLEQTAQDTPNSVVVVGADVLDKPAFTDVSDFLKTIPNVTFESGSFSPTVRGVSGGGVASGADGAVTGGRPRLTTYVDGVPRSFSFVPNGVPQTWDINQLEFYRGAQSTTIGRNAIAGALVVTTADPTNEFEATAQVGVRTEDTTYSGAVTLNAPIIDDRLALRVTADGYEGDGFVDYGGFFLSPFNDQIKQDEGHRIRAKLSLRPSGFDDNASIRIAYEKQETRRPSPEELVDITSTNATLTDPFSIAVFELENELISIEGRADLNENWSVYGIASYQESFEEGPGIDPSNPSFYLDVFADSEEMTQELRFNYEGDNGFQAAVGAFYFSRERVEGGDPASAFPYDATDEASTFAIFADTVIPVGRFDILAGARWEQEKQDRDFVSTPFFVGLDFDRTQSIFLPKVGLRWNVNDDQSLTGLYYKGYSPAAAGFAIFSLTPGPYTFDEEISDTIELAWRSSYPDLGFDLNANVFYTKFDGQQTTDPLTTFIVNVEETEYIGAEADLTWYPNDELTLQASIGVLNTEIKDFGTSAGSIFNGNELGFDPDLTARLSADWSPIENFSIGGTVSYTGSYYSFFDNAVVDEVDAYTLVDIRAEYSMGPVTVFGYVENLTDNDYDTFRDSLFGTRNIGRPRTVGGALRVNF